MTHFGYKQTAEHREKISIYRKRVWQDPEYRDRMLDELDRATKLANLVNQTPEAKEKRATTHRGTKRSELTRVRMSISASKRPLSSTMENTSLERAVQSYLSGVVEFQTQYPVELPDGRIHRSDIYVPAFKLLIECDGEYWHTRPKQHAFDEYFDRQATILGYSIIRLSETEILSGVFRNRLATHLTMFPQVKNSPLEQM